MQLEGTASGYAIGNGCKRRLGVHEDVCPKNGTSLDDDTPAFANTAHDEFALFEIGGVVVERENRELQGPRY